MCMKWTSGCNRTWLFGCVWRATQGMRMWGVLGLVLSICLCVIPALPLTTDDVQDPGHYLNSFLIRVENREIAEHVAAKHGFKVLDELSPLNIYHLYHPEVTGRSKRSADSFTDRLKQDPRVSFAEQQITLKRVKRGGRILHDKQLELPIRDIRNLSMFYREPLSKVATRGQTFFKKEDPLYEDMWYLSNHGQTGGKRDIDLNVVPAWQNGFTGREVVVSVLDDGIDHNHPDLKKNYDARASADFNDENDDDPTPDTTRSGNSHGTRCAGEIAAEAGNNVCGLGIAYNARIGGMRILDGKVTDWLESSALLHENQYIDIMSASWGPHDDGSTMEGPKKACTAALKEGATKGRGGKGTIFVWATGNGGAHGDNCACDGYVSSPYSISIGSLSDEGKMPFFMEACSSTMAVIPTGGAPTQDEELRQGKYKINVVTTDLDNGCTEMFEGTSAAAPLGAGCIALALQANANLSARDVQHLIAMGSRIPTIDESWTINGAGFHVNYKYGFGMMDCSKMVELAQTWKSVPDVHTCDIPPQTLNVDIPSSGCHKLQFDFDGCQGDPRDSITNLEHVELHIKLTTGRRGDTEIFLTSPAGTRSVMLQRRVNDDAEDGIDFTFMTVHNWGENPSGQWTLEVCNNPGRGSRQRPNEGVFISWALTSYGFHDQKPAKMKRAYTPTAEKLEATMKMELSEAKRIVIKRASEPLQDIDQKTTVVVDKKKSAEEASHYKGFLKELSRLFSRRQLEDIGIDARDIETLYDTHSESTANSENEAEVEEDNGYNFKRGYNIGAIEDVLNLGDDVVDKGVSSDTADEDDFESLKREILDLWEDVLDTADTYKTDQTERGYLNEYYKRKKKLERQKRINSLLHEIEEYLERKK